MSFARLHPHREIVNDASALPGSARGGTKGGVGWRAVKHG